jgi:hypothetical protein
LEQRSDHNALFADQSALMGAGEAQSASAEQNQVDESVSAQESAYWLDETGIPILRATRSWIQYGTVGFAVICIVIGAVEALFGR